MVASGHGVHALSGTRGSGGRVVLAVETRPDRLGVYNGELLFGVTSEANRLGIEIGLWTAVPDIGLALTPRLPPAAVDGAITVGHLAGDPWIQELAAAQVPIVVLGRWSGVEGRVHCVDSDHERGTEMLMSHLASLGRRRIAAVTGPLDVPDVILRLHAYERLRVELDLDPDPGLVVTGDFTAATGQDAFEHLLAAGGGAPDAVFAMNDAMAAGVVRAARRAGLRVPNDVAVVGFDAVIDPLLLPMSITTVRQDVAELGRRSLRALLDVIAGASPGETEVLATELVLGESTMGPSASRPGPRRHLAPVRN